MIARSGYSPAHTAVRRALLKGVLKRETCEACGNVETVAHHDDYAQPLDVRWLCVSHHLQWHHTNVAKNIGFQPQMPSPTVPYKWTLTVETLIAKVEAWCKTNKVMKKDLAAMLGMTPQALNDVLSGRNQPKGETALHMQEIIQTKPRK